MENKRNKKKEALIHIVSICDLSLFAINADELDIAVNPELALNVRRTSRRERHLQDQSRVRGDQTREAPV